MSYKVFVDGKFDQYYSVAMTGGAGWIKATGPNTVEIHESDGSATVVKTGQFLAQKWAIFYYTDTLTNYGCVYNNLDEAMAAYVAWDFKKTRCNKSHIQEIWV